MFAFRSIFALVLIGSAGALLDASFSSAAAEDGLSYASCGDLWYRRNAIFARNGYCFKTDRAIRAFGNEGCRFYVEGDVPLSRGERGQVEYIRSLESRRGCRG